MAQSLFEKIWASHVVTPETEDTPAVLYVDLHLLHEVTTPQAFDLLRSRGLPVRRTDRCLATLDHSTPTVPVTSLKDLDVVSEPSAAKQVRQMEKNCKDFGIELRGFASRERGIVHVMGPELGATPPGATIVCGDSHTATHGAFGALAFGIGTSEVEMVLATQCLLQRKPKSYLVRVDGQLKPGVSAKDIILALIARIGVGGGTGHIFEYAGSAIRTLSMEERMTICNMSIEGGARAGLIAPDETTFAYLKGRAHAPQGAAWEKSVDYWRTLTSDADARYDKEIVIDADALEPMVTYGTNPGMGVGISQRVPDPAAATDPSQRRALERTGVSREIGTEIDDRHRLGGVTRFLRFGLIHGVSFKFCEKPGSMAYRARQ